MSTKTTAPVKVKDKYDLEIEELLKFSGEEFKRAVAEHWENCDPLFSMTGHVCPDPLHDYGCLTMVKGEKEGGYYIAPTPELTAAIRSDPRIPPTPERITKKSLPAFAEWQRRLDAELGEGR